jgi:hypothetical protein
LDIEQDKNTDNSRKKIFADLSEVPLLSGHETFMVRADSEIEARWEELTRNQSDMNSAQKALAVRIFTFLKTEGLLDELGGIAATNFNCVWLTCSLRVWHRLELGMNLSAWSNPEITPER